MDRRFLMCASCTTTKLVPCFLMCAFFVFDNAAASPSANVVINSSYGFESTLKIIVAVDVNICYCDFGTAAADPRQLDEESSSDLVR